MYIGGFTVWPRAGVSYHPENGDGVFWFNLLRNEKLDRYTTHSACGVLSGSKWIANKWIGYNAQWNTKMCSISQDKRFDAFS